MDSIIIVAVIVAKCMVEDMAECMAEAVFESGDAVTQLYRRMHIQVIGYIASRIDGASKTVYDQRNRRRRVYRNCDWHWYRHRLLHWNRIWLLHWHRDWLLHWNEYRMLYRDRYCLQMGNAININTVAFTGVYTIFDAFILKRNIFIKIFV